MALQLGGPPVRLAVAVAATLLLVPHSTMAKRHSDALSVLTIRDIGYEDTGNYTCVASNDYGWDEQTAQLLVSGPPVLQFFTFPPDVTVGEDATFRCFVKSGRPPYHFRWLKGDQDVHATDKLIVTVVSERVATLNVRRVTIEDSGNYTCLVSDSTGAQSAITASLGIPGAPKLREFAFPDEVSLGEDITSAASSGEEPRDLTAFDGTRTVTSWRKLSACRSLPEARAARRYASPVSEPRTSGTTRAPLAMPSGATASRHRSSSTVNGRLSTPSEYFDVHNPPKLRTAGFSSDLSLGEDTMATCFVKKGSEGPYTMAWYRNGEEVKETARVKTSVKATGTTIAIDGIQVEDVANYTCTAANAEGSDALTLSLVVAGPPDLREFAFPSEVALGEEILVGCFVKKGTAGPYRITWLKDSREIQESERVSIAARSKTSAALRISSLRAEDVANYTCVASNDFGTDSVTAPLIINGFRVHSNSGGHFKPLFRVSVTSHKGGPVSTLTIVDLSASDSGNYTCVARNAAGSDSFSAFLAVTGAPKLQSSGFPNELSLGEETVATCFVKKGSTGPYSLTWHKDGKPVQNSDRVVVTGKSASIALSIDGVQVEDIGNYTCSATNSAGTDVLTLPLLISAPPSIRSFSFPSEIALGEEVIVVCSVKKGSSSDSYSIGWQKDGRAVSETGRVSTSSHSKGSATLLIASLEPEDVGNYTCTARNAFGTDSFTAPLVVNGSPKLLEFAFPHDVALGDEVIVPCVVRKGTTGPYRIIWYKDGVDLQENTGRVSVSFANTKRSSTLQIASLQPEDVGNYTCSVSNSFGSDSFTAPLLVNDAPKIKEFEFPATLSPGDTVAVVCVVQKGSAGPYELTWWKDDRPVAPTASLTVTSSKGGPVSTLTIADVSSRDSGNYSCLARNAAGSDRFFAYLAVTVTAMSVLVFPTPHSGGTYKCQEHSGAYRNLQLCISPTASSMIADHPKPSSLGFPPNLAMGDEAIASCFVPRGRWQTGDVRLRLAWKRDNGEDLSTNRRVSLLSASESSVTLSIRDIRPEDVGNYTCVASYGDASESITVPLSVSELPVPREFSFPPEVALGEHILVSCAVKKGATGLHKMTWLKDGKELQNSDRVSVSAQFSGGVTLRIADLRPEDVGNYSCGIAGPFVLSWLKDDRPLEPTSSMTVTFIKGGPVSTLTIVDVSAQDSGNYTCVARNAAGSDRFTAYLAVTVHVPKPQTSGFQPDLALGDDAIASCFVRKASWHGGGLRMTWTKSGNDDGDLSSNDRVSFHRASKSSITLGIRDVRREDIGNYTCIVSYGASSSASVTVPLIISEVPPKIKEFKFPDNLSPGDTAVVSCVVKKGSSGPFELYWKKDGLPVEQTGSVTVTSHKGGPLSMLSIVDITAEHSGNYSCVARNAAGMDESSAHLAVTGGGSCPSPPKERVIRPLHIFLLESAQIRRASARFCEVKSAGFPGEVSLGEDIVVTCSVKKGSAGPYTLTWLKDGAPLESSGHVTTSFKASATSLNIDGVRVEDVGNYTCAATNAFGSDALTLPLMIAEYVER
ncbi:hypothetical protein HPB50_006454 [Hyalomma asiaticum]|uniref:Uncharacterized protein n=1 Tax=Hyalomma asiaticum TaxID=266040 RepID=A0ACB7RN34_HYAAI|nr:hypothetical protein HPB50_006454 [Hyalomma asiaticum]